MELITKLKGRIDRIEDNRSVVKQTLKEVTVDVNQNRQVQRESHVPIYKQPPFDNLGTNA